MAKEHEKNPIKIPNGELNKCTSKDLLCEHKDSAVPYFALGLCETCYKDVSHFFLMHTGFYELLMIVTIYCSTDCYSLINSLVDLVVVWILLHSSVLRRRE